MKAKFRARYNAYTLALAHVKEHEALTSEVPAIAEAYAAGKKLLDAIEAAQSRRSQRQESATLSKATITGELAEEAYSVATLINSYASRKGDTVLADEVNFTPSSLSRAIPIDLEARATIIYDKAKALGDVLKPFGMSPERLIAFGALLEAYNTGKLAPRRYIAERSQATLEVEELVNELTVLFDEQLDGLMLQYRKSEPEFYNQYLIKRTVVQTGHRKTQVQGTITEKGSASPLAGVRISVKGSAISTQSEADGAYTLYAAPFSGAVVVYEREGYRTVEITTDILRGKATRQPVEMEKI